MCWRRRCAGELAAEDFDAIKSIIALGALPFVFVVLLLVVCLLKTLKTEPGESA